MKTKAASPWITSVPRGRDGRTSHTQSPWHHSAPIRFSRANRREISRIENRNRQNRRRAMPINCDPGDGPESLRNCIHLYANCGVAEHSAKVQFGRVYGGPPGAHRKAEVIADVSNDNFASAGRGICARQAYRGEAGFSAVTVLRYSGTGRPAFSRVAIMRSARGRASQTWSLRGMMSRPSASRKRTT